MANGWTAERKAKQRKLIYHWRPWEKSTGPKTKTGKDAVARNALKHGCRSASVRAELAAIRQLLGAPGRAPITPGCSNLSETITTKVLT